MLCRRYHIYTESRSWFTEYTSTIQVLFVRFREKLRKSAPFCLSEVCIFTPFCKLGKLSSEFRLHEYDVRAYRMLWCFPASVWEISRARSGKVRKALVGKVARAGQPTNRQACLITGLPHSHDLVSPVGIEPWRSGTETSPSLQVLCIPFLGLGVMVLGLATPRRCLRIPVGWRAWLGPGVWLGGWCVLRACPFFASCLVGQQSTGGTPV